MENNENQIILDIHYYLQNNSHSMDMSIRNKLDKYIFNILQEISKALDIQIQLETLAYKEGGLKEIVKICYKVGAKVIAPQAIAAIISGLTMHYLTGNPTLSPEQIENIKTDTQLKKVQIENINVDTQLKKVQIENIKTDTQLKQAQLEEFNQKSESNIKQEKEIIEQARENLTTNTKFNKNLSDYYKTAKEYSKIEQIGYKTDDIQSEKIVPRDKFEDFIIINKEITEIQKEITIIILSPILQAKSKYKWKGIYEDKVIEFTMLDKDFKKGIENQEYNFLSGTAIVCDLTIITQYDKNGTASSKPTYKVDNVKEIFNVENFELGNKKIIKRKKKNLDDDVNIFEQLKDLNLAYEESLNKHPKS